MVGLEVVLFVSIVIAYFGLLMLWLVVFKLDLSWLMFVRLALGLVVYGISVMGIAGWYVF